MSECLECGEKAPHFHPDYNDGTYGDRLCSGCLIGYWDNKIQECYEELRGAEDATGIQSTEWPED